MDQKTHKSVLVKKSTWIISMVACFAFILMAIEVYQVSTYHCEKSTAGYFGHYSYSNSCIFDCMGRIKTAQET